MCALLAPSSVKYAVHNLGQCVISFNIAKNPLLSMFVWIWSRNTLVYEVYKVFNVGNGVILRTLVATTKTLKPYTYKEKERWKSIFWACWHHWSMTLKGWVTEFQFHEVALCFLEQPLTFSHFRPSQFSWFVDVIVIVLSSLLHITFFRLYWRPNSLSKDRPRH